MTSSLFYDVQPFLLPPGLNFFIVVVGFLIWFAWRRVGQIIMLLGFFSLWLLSMPVVAYHLMDFLQQQYAMLPIDPPTNVKSRYAIVVLGGGDSVEAEYGNRQTVSDITFQRLSYAAHLYKKTQFPIIVSGGNANNIGNNSADLMSKVLQDHFNITAAFKENQSITTSDESKLIIPILKNNHIDAIYLVTNAWHMPRSVYIFQCRGIQVIPAPMGYFVYGPGYAFISYLPNMNALHASSIVVHEFIGMMWYRVRYGNQCV